MIYLITVLAPWLLLTAAFAGLAGWALAAERGMPAELAQRRERDKLVRDLAQLAAGEATPQTAIVNDADTARSLAAIRDGRIAELERSLEQSRSRAAELAGELAELQRRSGRREADNAELARPRGLVDAPAAQAAQTIEAHAQSTQDENAALQTWRLRYFEQRVKFLEGRGLPALAALPAPAPAAMSGESESTASAQASPFAASADVDALLRWRMLYLERRAAHLRELAGSLAVAPAPALETAAQESGPDPDRWKWRARYLESRVRHLEQRDVQSAPQPAPAEPETVNGAEPPREEPQSPPPLVPAGAEERPPGLPAANSGAPDDFSLIDGVSPLQQSTLYSLGVYHFDQIAAWTPANIAWVDKYLRLRGRISEEEWVEQAQDLAREGAPALTASH